MKRRKVRFSATAEDELLLVWEHIAEFSLDRADSFVVRLRARCVRLGQIAGLGRPYQRKPGVRVYSTMNYLVFYTVEPLDIRILHVIHGARDFERILERDDG